MLTQESKIRPKFSLQHYVSVSFRQLIIQNTDQSDYRCLNDQLFEWSVVRMISSPNDQ